MVAHAITVVFMSFMIYTAWPGSSLFSWHPTLMSIAFIGFMFEALMVFNPESSLIVNAAYATKVLVHQVLGITSLVCAYLGFAVIYYNKSINDKPHFTTWHGLMGIITIVFASFQAFGGNIVKYSWLRSCLPINTSLADMKIRHATSGLVAFTLVTSTLMLSLYSSWFTSQVEGLLWWMCQACVSVMAVLIMNRVVSEYLPRTQRRPKTAVAKKAIGSKKRN